MREVTGVHLVGSVPLSDAEAVFRRVAGALGDRLRRMPDGETGPRSEWIGWQHAVFCASPLLEVASPDAAHERELAPLRLRPDARVEDLEFGELGYARAAIASYELFAALKRDGVIAPGCRFLLSLPTPLAPVSAFVIIEDQPAVEPAYEAHMVAEVRRVLAAIPAAELAIQWDARYEFSVLEGAVAVAFSDVRTGIPERLARLSRLIPAEVELGYHLCYGDEEYGHFVEPEDARHLVDVANALAEDLDRPLDWIHMPVPHGRADDAYFAPLRSLRLPTSDSRGRASGSPRRGGTCRRSGWRPSAGGGGATRRWSMGCSNCIGPCVSPWSPRLRADVVRDGDGLSGGTEPAIVVDGLQTGPRRREAATEGEGLGRRAAARHELHPLLGLGEGRHVSGGTHHSTWMASASLWNHSRRRRMSATWSALP